MTPFATRTLQAPLPVLLIAVLVALLLGSQVLGSVNAADLDMQAAHQTHAHHADMADMADPPSDAMGCETGACCADSCSQVGLSSVDSLLFVPGRHRPTLRLAFTATSQLGAIYRPPRHSV